MGSIYFTDSNDQFYSEQYAIIPIEQSTKVIYGKQSFFTFCNILLQNADIALECKVHVLNVKDFKTNPTYIPQLETVPLASLGITATCSISFKTIHNSSPQSNCRVDEQSYLSSIKTSFTLLYCGAGGGSATE